MCDSKFDQYFARLDEAEQVVALKVRDAVREAVGANLRVSETTKWNYPAWVHEGKNGNMCSIMGATGYVRLQFFRGAELRQAELRLEGTGKGMRHLKVWCDREFPRRRFGRWLRTRRCCTRLLPREFAGGFVFPLARGVITELRRGGSGGRWDPLSLGLVPLQGGVKNRAGSSPLQRSEELVGVNRALGVSGTLRDSRGSAGSVSEVIEAGAADSASTGDLNLFDPRRVIEECALDADAFGHSADREVRR